MLQRCKGIDIIYEFLQSLQDTLQSHRPCQKVPSCFQTLSWAKIHKPLDAILIIIHIYVGTAKVKFFTTFLI